LKVGEVVVSVGIVYIASIEERSLEEAFLSAENVKNVAPSLPVTLFTDEPRHPLCRLGVFDEVIPIERVKATLPPWSQGKLLNLRSLMKTPYERTLHLDTDMRVLTAEVVKLFELLNDADVAMVETSLDSYSRFHAGRRMYNPSLILYRSNEKTKSWLSEWASLSERNFQMAQQTALPSLPVLSHIKDEAVRRKLLGMAQISMLELLSPETNRFNLGVRPLDYSWNHCGSVLPENNRQPIRIKYWLDLKKATRPDLLLLAYRWKKENRIQDAAALYDYIASCRSAQKVPVSPLFRWLRGTHADRPVHWSNPVLMEADLHYGERQFEPALALYEMVLGNDHQNAYALAGKGEIRVIQGQQEDGMTLLARAASLCPNDAHVLTLYGRVLGFIDRSEDAIAPLTRALAKGGADAAFALAEAEYKSTHYQAAAKAYRRTLRLNPSHRVANNNILMALTGQRDYRGVVDHANRLLADDSWHVNALAFKCIALAELGRREEEKQLADFDRLVESREIEVPIGFSNLNQFNQALATYLAKEPSLKPAPPQHATRAGWHSGDLTNCTNPAVSALNKLLIREATRRMAKTRARGGAHPFEIHIPDGFVVNSWVVIMEGTGHQIPHVHRDAWLSGVYYVDLPADIGAEEEDHQGWLRFGPSKECWHTGHSAPAAKLICPKAGMVVTFPSFFWHETVPLRADTKGRRISYAFDILPIL
jgi:uncharacterized protein (TIGR02466 family)